MTSCYCSSTCSSASAKKLLQHFERTSETALKAAARRWSTSSLQLSSNPKSCTRLLYTHFYYRRRRVENVSHMWASSTRAPTLMYMSLFLFKQPLFLSLKLIRSDLYSCCSRSSKSVQFHRLKLLVKPPKYFERCQQPLQLYTVCKFQYFCLIIP